MAAATGCGELSVDALAIWVDGSADVQGRRHVRLYEGGGRQSLPIVPDIRGTGTELLTVGLDRRGRGVLVSGIEETVWVDRTSSRQVVMTPASVGREGVSFADQLRFTRSGDAIVRRLDAVDGGAVSWAMASLSGMGGGTPRLLEPPDDPAPGQRWSIHTGSDAPVLFFVETLVSAMQSSPSGRVHAFAYPSEFGEGPIVDEWLPLGEGTIQWRVPSANVLSHLEAPSCTERLCVSPSGRHLYGMAPGGTCDLTHWSWTDAAATDDPVPHTVVSVSCPGGAGTGLVAVLADDLVVLDDPHRIYLLDLTTERVQSVPKAVGINIAHTIDDGHGLLVTGSRGEVIRIDAAGPRVVSGEQALCTLHDGIAVSPNGQWVIRSCNGQSGAPDGVDGQVQRTSVLGAELYPGVPMRPIAIDDEGNALLYSVASDDDDGVPRGLFVLSGDGRIARVDPLEPTPSRLPVLEFDAVRPLYFAASGPL